MTISAAILTVSDKGSRGERVDTAGPAVAEVLRSRGIEVTETAIVPDERGSISARLRRWCDNAGLNVIVTTGGTGLAERDVTPEATLSVVDRTVPGMAELMREAGRRTTPMAALSRSVVGTRNKTLIINVPGSEAAARESIEAIVALIPHAVQLMSGEAAEHPLAQPISD